MAFVRRREGMAERGESGEGNILAGIEPIFAPNSERMAHYYPLQTDSAGCKQEVHIKTNNSGNCPSLVVSNLPRTINR